MKEIDICDIGGKDLESYSRQPYFAYYQSIDLSAKAKGLLFVMQRLVDLDMPLTISNLSKYCKRSPFEVKMEIDEIERAGLRIREYDEASGEYKLIRY